nr:hypothetical protein Iba_chr03cCG1260 [Ipomoea batatas]
MCFGAEKWDTSGDASVRAIGESFGLYVIHIYIYIYIYIYIIKIKLSTLVSIITAASFSQYSLRKFLVSQSLRLMAPSLNRQQRQCDTE